MINGIDKFHFFMENREFWLPVFLFVINIKLLSSNALVVNIKRVTILSDHYGSDHCPIALEIDL